MIHNILSEKDYQRFLLERLEKDNGYVIRKATNFDRSFTMDREMLFQFLNDTQPDTMDYLRKIYKSDLEDTIVSFINAETTKARGSLIEVLKHGIEISNQKLELMYTKPATTFNPELTRKYGQNIFSVMEEVWASDKERIDVVIFLNGLAIISFELKCNTAGQSYQDAIYQYRTERNPKTRLFLFKAGCLVNFAMDLEEVYMTTKLAGEATFFLPFNMGNGEGVTAGAGNPTFEDKYSVSYMWEDILTKDTILDLISKFIFVEVKEKVDDQTGKIKRSENLIFPRYHQLDVIRKILADVRVNRTAQNYLIQHSAGSGKTNSIAWLAHRLSSLHDADNKIIFDNIIIVTDRVVVDRQLQKAIMGMEHKAGLIRVMDDKCNSADLAIALNGNTKIIATTIQKFPYIVDSVKDLKSKRFAVIIDEAHSSTAGKDMKTQSDKAIKGFLNQLFRKNRLDRWNSYDTTIAISYLIQSKFRHIDLLEILSNRHPNLYNYYLFHCKSSTIHCFDLWRVKKLGEIIARDNKAHYLYFMYLCEMKRANYMAAFAYYKNYFDRVTADLDFAAGNDPSLKKPNYNMFYREGMLIRFYTGVDDSKTVIENAHKLRNANPLSHASSQLLDSNDTSKDLCKSIKALSKLIYGYIDKHKERA